MLTKWTIFKTQIRRIQTQIRRSADSTDLADSYFNPHLDRLGYF